MKYTKSCELGVWLVSLIGLESVSISILIGLIGGIIF